MTCLLSAITAEQAAWSVVVSGVSFVLGFHAGVRWPRPIRRR